MNKHEHHDHSDHHHHHHTAADAAGTVKDPVCGMTVEPDKGKPSLQHGGQTYHFCSQK